MATGGDLRYQKEYDEGRIAYYWDDLDIECPYSTKELGKRCAWLGGWWDAQREEEGNE
jgi:ribosome modulation factor